MVTSVDLHMHTTFSDGTSDPEPLLEALARQGIKTLAVTDHDTTAAYERLIPKAQELGLELIRGIEINTHWQDTEVHILGYFIQFESSDLQGLARLHRERRIEQIGKMVEKINQQTNHAITLGQVLEQARPGGSLGRPHMARALMEVKAVSHLGEAFNKYLTPQCSTYVARPTASPHEAVEAIHAAGGIPVVAHPGLTNHLEQLVPELKVYGLQGLEAYHKAHSPAEVEYICTLAERHDLMVTGGTDFHGVPDLYPNAHRRLVMPNSVREVLISRQPKPLKVSTKVRFKSA
jgi:3',5'-nucleoside bisphosphate phosphatase